ncbi:MAG: flagellar motor protein [Desmonostoc vinosum HA7617-LM4]|jgi:outer membrane protein OmpA-like peptidoglycan-associated protein|nr:flagellar motor protein [Desmonostoc vinosum HA7617-LM4]
MTRRSRHTNYHEDLNIWPAFTDLMSNAFMIILLMLFIASSSYTISQISNNQNKGTPPILLIKDENYRFDLGSAEIPMAMLDYITNKLVPDIEKTTKDFNINTVEIIGHTDEQPIGSVNSNLDKNLEAAASSEGSVSNLKAGSNADLGLMRSLAVVKELLKIQQQQARMQKIKFRAYSAAQLILPNGEFAPIPQALRQSQATRRRIEIRFTRLGQVREVR